MSARGYLIKQYGVRSQREQRSGARINLSKEKGFQQEIPNEFNGDRQSSQTTSPQNPVTSFLSVGG